MTWPGPGEDRWEDPSEDAYDNVSVRWPLDWRGLYPRERWLWFEQLWCEVCMLRHRYRLAIRSGWWENEIQLEALAALAAWVSRYDSGEWDDPPGKLALLYDLERVSTLLRDGADPFHPDRDRTAFIQHLLELGCQPPPTLESGEAHGFPCWPPQPADGDWPLDQNGSSSPRANGYEHPPETEY